MAAAPLISDEEREAIRKSLEFVPTHPMWMTAFFWIDANNDLQCVPVAVHDMPEESFNKAGRLLSEKLHDGLKAQSRRIVAPGNGFAP